MQNDILIWNENELNTEKLRKVYSVINWLNYEMRNGKVENAMLGNSLTFVKMAENGEFDDTTIIENSSMFLEWYVSQDYEINSLRRYQGKIYRCLQAHTSQEGWEPNITPALWKKCGVTENGIPEWSQPISSVDAYNIGDEVMYNGVHYKSLIDGNVWAPDAYPQGWEIVK